MATKHFMIGSSSNSSSHYAGGYDDQKSKAGSSSNPLHNYEVFLSFNGDDTRHGFTDHLYHKLINNGIRVFRDKESLHKGQKIDQLLEAITASKILVPIISTNYASSKWCLKELVQIVKCNKSPAQLVLPIFYKVKPSDVREQKDLFGEGFRLFKENHSDDIELVQESKQAFEEIATLIGWDSNKSHDGYEVPLVNEVVRKIFNELREPILDVSECLVGVKEHVEEVKKKIYAEQSNEAKIIAIHGMGGIGKTTLAKALYNELFFCDFDCCSFVPNIRERSSTYEGTMDMQKRLISDLLVDKSLREISHVDEGINTIKRSYKGKNVLLLLDDIDDKDQLKKLAVKNNCLGSKSIVIITTRDEVVTKASGVNLSYQLNELGENQSYELLCKHAFRGATFCPSNLEDIARGITSKVGGLPLAIEVIGSLLYQQSEAFWRTKLQELKMMPIVEVMDSLMLSYEALDRNEKEIFLDIACLPIQHQSKYAHYMWDACHFYPTLRIERLISKSLIKIKDDIIVMHDQLRDLGWEIVRKEGCYNIGLYSRLWLREETREVIERKKGTANIQALEVGFLGNEIHFTSQQFEGMENLRFLLMKEVYLTGDFENLFSNIIWLQWIGMRSCVDIMGINIILKKLVILQLCRANITEHWKGWNQVKKLKVLILDQCNKISASPDFSIVEGLEELVLNNCDVLEKIHPSIGKFRKTLKILHVMGCHKLEELPITVLCGLTSLSFSGDSMETLPDISNLTNLKHLRYNDVFERRNIVLNLRKLNQLETLEILHSSLLSQWSDGTDLDEASEDINLLLELPLGLQELTVCGCQTLRTFPNLSNLKNLSRLTLEDCSELNHLELEGAESLTDLCIERCKKLSKVSGVGTMVTNLKLKSLGALQSLPTLSASKKLKNLNTGGCSNLVEIQRLEDVGTLEGLTIESCCSFKGIANLSHLTTLSKLQKWDLEDFKGLKSLSNLPCGLTSLSFSGDSMETLPDISNLTNLKHLRYKDVFERRNRVLNLRKLNQLETLEILHSNDVLEILHSNDLSEILHSGLLSKWSGGRELNEASEDINLLLELPLGLKELKVCGCQTLRTFPNLSNLKNLSRLTLRDCSELNHLELEGAESLTDLCIEKCKKLSKLSGVGSMVTDLKLKSLGALQSLPNLSASKKLKNLNIARCRNLVEIQGLEDVETLETLTIESCCSFERIANLTHLTMLSKLQKVDLKDCKKLKSLSNLPCGLTSLSFNGDSMETLPDISNLTDLKHLRYEDVFERRNRALNLRKLNQLETLEILHSGLLSKWSSGIELNEASEDINLLLELPLGLKELKVCGCQTLRTFPNLSNLKNLSRLTLRECSELNHLELEGAESLTDLCIEGCKKLSKLSGVGSMVTNLILESLGALQSLPNLSTLKKLKNLNIDGCSNLVEIQGLEEVETLETLTIKKCCSLERIANLSHLSMLTTLEFCDCDKLSNVQGIEGLTSLVELCISEPLLNSLDLSQLTKLHRQEIIPKLPPLKEEEESQSDVTHQRAEKEVIPTNLSGMCDKMTTILGSLCCCSTLWATDR